LRSGLWKTRSTVTGIVAVLGLVACGATPSGASTAGSGSKASAVPSSAYADHTGITADSVHVANVSTLSGGLAKGALVGTQAYAAYVNAKGGVDGRRIVVDSTNDNFTGAGNKQGVQSAIQNDFALVGGFSLEDSFGGAVLGQNPGMPDVAVVLDPHLSTLPNVFSPAPASDGWNLGPLEYLKKKFPKDIGAVGTLVNDLPSSLPAWLGEKYALEKAGYKVIYQPTYTLSQTDFTQNVIQMKDAGVKMLFVDQLPAIYAASLIKSLQQQDYHPVVVLGATAYTNTMVANAGGAANVDGDYLEQNQSLYLGGDKALVPAVATFLHWVNVASPGFQPDLFTLYGWLSAELFADGLKNAGHDPSRGSLLKALRTITTFDGNGIVAPADPVTKAPSNCYLVGRVVDGQFRRVDDPPVGGPDHGFRCDYAYIKPPGG
jgi:ABC-type branched-subunit amino acid transport system substrate-binding protein